MSTAANQPEILDEEIWRAWLQERKQREDGTARRVIVAGEILLILLTLGFGIYRLAG